MTHPTPSSLYRSAILLLLIAVCFSVKAHDFSVINNDGDTIYYKHLPDNTLCVTYKGDDMYTYTNEYSGDISIPDFVSYNNTNYSVTSIDAGAFAWCEYLTSIIIPSSTTSIGRAAFQGCSRLSTILIPSIVTSIGNRAFYGCSNLDSVTIPTSVSSIGDSVFYMCGSLSSITIPSSVTSIGSWSFFNCENLTTLNISNAVIEIGQGAFENCFSLSQFTIPNTISSINAKTFKNCRSLTSINIPNTVTSIGEEAFKNCSGLTSVIIPNSVSRLDRGTFWDCSNLSSVSIPPSLSSTGEYTFRGCYNLTSVTIPSSIVSIDESAFEDCRSLSSITIPSSVLSIGRYAFNNCESLTSVSLPSSVSSIEECAFAHCQSLNSLTISPSVTSIRRAAFEDCISLTTVSIPSSVTSIEPWAFARCYNLSFVTMPPSLISIGEGAFESCRNLSSITIPSLVTTIESAAFQNCSSLTSIVIPSSVMSIGQHAFHLCGMLDTVTIESSCILPNNLFANTWISHLNLPHYIPPAVDNIDNTLFLGVTNNTIIHVPCPAIDNYRNDTVWGQYSNIRGMYVDAIESRIVCGSYLCPDGNTYISDTIVTYSVPNSICDSIMTLTLSVLPTYRQEDTITLCDDMLPLSYNDSVFDIAGFHYFQFNSVDGCDSVIVLNLIINPTYQHNEEQVVCDNMYPYFYADSSFDGSGNYILSFVSQLGCDSTVNLEITTVETYQHTDTLIICDNIFPYLYGDSLFTAEGQYVVEFSSLYNCDSVVTLVLMTNPTYQHTDAMTLCDNILPYTYGNCSLTTAGQHVISFNTIHNCDSVITLGLTVNPTYQHADTVTLCDGMLPFSYGDSLLNTTGLYDIAFSSIDGCDSVITLGLTVNPTYQHADAVTLCDDMLPFSYGDSLLNTTGLYDIAFSSINGCDSIITLGLTVNLTYEEEDYMTICQSNLPFSYGDSIFDEATTSGNYAVMMTSQQGCDSLIVLGLNINQSEETALQMVSVENNLCKVTWQKQAEVEHYNIYREGTGVNPFDLVAAVPFDAAPYWIDSTTNPKSRLYRYKITSVDSCGVESSLSESHATIHLIIADGVENSHNLIWNPYEGAAYTYYRIYRGRQEHNQVLIDSVPASYTSYSDYDDPSAHVFYSVAAVLIDGEAKSVVEVHSNTASPDEVGIEEVFAEEQTWQLQAEKGALIVQGAEGKTLQIYDAYGRLLKQINRAAEEERYEVPAAGLYIVKMQGGESKKITVLK